MSSYAVLAEQQKKMQEAQEFANEGGVVSGPPGGQEPDAAPPRGADADSSFGFNIPTMSADNFLNYFLLDKPMSELEQTRIQAPDYFSPVARPAQLPSVDDILNTAPSAISPTQGLAPMPVGIPPQPVADQQPTQDIPEFLERPEPNEDVLNKQSIDPVVTSELEDGRAATDDFGDIQRAYEDLQLADANLAKGQSAIDAEKAAIIENQIEQRRQVEELRKTALKNAEMEMNIIVDDIKSFKVNPSRLFPNTMSRLGAAIAVAIGGFAEAYSGGRVRNTALDILNTAIAQDIEAQKSTLGAKQSALQAEQNAYGRLLNKYKREDLATDALEIQELEMVKGRVGDILKKAGIQRDGDHPLSMLLLKLDKQTAEKKIEWIKVKSDMDARKGQQMLSFYKMQMEARQAAAQQRAEELKLMNEQANLKIPEKMIEDISKIAESESVWKQYRALAANLKKANADHKARTGQDLYPAKFSLEDIFKEGLNVVLPDWMNPGIKGQVNMLKRLLGVDFMSAKEGGRMTDRDRTFYLQLFPGFATTLFSSETADFRIKTLMAIRHRGFLAKFQGQPLNVKKAILDRYPMMREIVEGAQEPSVQAALSHYDAVKSMDEKFGATYSGKPADISQMPRLDAAVELDPETGVFKKKSPGI